MKCARFEELICDYLDATLRLEDRRRLEDHASGCSGCSETLAEAQWVTEALRDVPAVEPPSDLVAGILQGTAAVGGPLLAPAGSAAGTRVSAWVRPFVRPWFEPRFAMSMAMVLLSFSMVTSSSERVWHDWHARGSGPAAMVRDAGQQLDRAWTRSLEFYEMILATYRIESAGTATAPKSRSEQGGGEREQSPGQETR